MINEIFLDICWKDWDRMQIFLKHCGISRKFQSFMYEMHNAYLFHLMEALWTILWLWPSCRYIDCSYNPASVSDVTKSFTKTRIFITKQYWLSLFHIYIFYSCFLRAVPMAYGSNHSCSCWSTPQPQQCWILNPLSKARDQTCVFTDTSQIRFHWATVRTPFCLFFYCLLVFSLLMWKSYF